MKYIFQLAFRSVPFSDIFYAPPLLVAWIVSTAGGGGSGSTGGYGGGGYNDYGNGGGGGGEFEAFVAKGLPLFD